MTKNIETSALDGTGDSESKNIITNKDPDVNSIESNEDGISEIETFDDELTIDNDISNSDDISKLNDSLENDDIAIGHKKENDSFDSGSEDDIDGIEGKWNDSFEDEEDDSNLDDTSYLNTEGDSDNESSFDSDDDSNWDDSDDDSNWGDSDDDDSLDGIDDCEYSDEFIESGNNLEDSKVGSDVEFSTYLHPEVERQKKKSKRSRRIFIAITIFLILIIIGVVAYSMQLANNASQSGQKTLETESRDVDTLGSESGTEVVSEVVVEDVVVPDMSKLFGLSSAEAEKLLPSETIVSAIASLDDPANPVKSEQTIKVGVTDGGKKEGPMKVFLGMDSNAIVIKAGLSTTVESLGYGLLSFADVINNEHIINATFEKAGITLDETVVLSSPAKDYATFDDKGNIMTEKGTFEGECNIAGVMHPWYATVVYDYKLYNATGKISKTQRDIYIYVEPSAEAVEANEIFQEELALEEEAAAAEATEVASA